MSAPFVYGKIATLDNFADREKETRHLIKNFRSLINTILISPRRWGKSSLVAKAAEAAREKDSRLRICHIDLFNIRSEEHFYEVLAQSVLEATSTRWEEMVESVRKFFHSLVPKIVLAGDQQNEFSLQFDWQEIKKKPDEILDLAEKIAKEKKMKIVICVDEFQNIAEFDSPLVLQKKLRSHWQRHQHVSYCLYGSKRHMMMEVFTNNSMPFYKFGDMLFLEKIDTQSWISFISERFASTGKSITPEQAELISRLADNHPYYVQQLAQQTWLRTKKKCQNSIVHTAHTSLVDQLSLLFTTITESLTTNQINLLKALIDNETALTSAETIKKYHFTSSASVIRVRNALVEKEIIDYHAGKYSFMDPMYCFWLKDSYFKNN